MAGLYHRINRAIDSGIKASWMQLGPIASLGASCAEEAGISVLKASHKAINLLFHKHLVTSIFIWFITRPKSELAATLFLAAFAWEGLSRRLQKNYNDGYLRSISRLNFAPIKSGKASPYSRVAEYFDISNQGKSLRVQLYKFQRDELLASKNDTYEANEHRGLKELLEIAEQMQASGADPGLEVGHEIHASAGTKPEGTITKQGEDAVKKLKEKIEQIDAEVTILNGKIGELSPSSAEANSNLVTIQLIVSVAFVTWAIGKLPVAGTISNSAIAIAAGAILGVEAYYQVATDPDTKIAPCAHCNHDPITGKSLAQ